MKNNLLVIWCFCLSCLAVSATTASSGLLNLLPGDTDLELEHQSLTGGAYSGPLNVIRMVSPGYQSKTCIRLDCQHMGMGSKAFKLPAGTYCFSFYAKSQAPKGVGFICVNPINCGWPDLLKRRRHNAIPMTSQWKRFHLSFNSDGKKLYSAYYGCQDSGACFDRFMINRGDTPLPWSPSAETSLVVRMPAGSGQVYPQGTPLTASVILVSHTGKRLSGNITCRITDHTGKTCYQKVHEPSYDATGHSAKLSLNVPVKRSGWFLLDVSHPQSGLKASSAYVLTRPPEPTLPDLMPFVGLVQAQEQLEAARRIGVKWLQVGVRWYFIEGRPGTLNFKSLKDLKHYRDLGFKIHGFLTMGPPEWALPKDMQKELRNMNVNYARCVAPEAVQDKHYRPLVKELMRRFGQDFDLFEIGGEVDAKLGLNPYYKRKDNRNMAGPFVLGESLRQVSHLIQIAAEEIRKVRPDALITCVRPCDVDVNLNFIYSKEVFKHVGKLMSCFGLDCYPRPRWIGPGQPATGSEQQLVKHHRNARKAMEGLIDSQDVLISEYGYFIDMDHLHDPPYVAEHINRLARSFLAARLVGMKVLHYYTTESQPLEGRRYVMGIWHNGQPLAAVAALNNVARVVENVIQCKELMPAPGVHLGLFRKHDNRAVAALWCQTPEDAITLELDDGHLTVTDIMGNPITPVTTPQGKIRLHVTTMPCYLWKNEPAGCISRLWGTAYQKDNYDGLLTCLQQSTVAKPPLKIQLDMTDTKHLNATLRCVDHTIQSNLTGNARVSFGKQTQTFPFALAPNQETALRLPLPPPGQTMTMVFTTNQNMLSQKRVWKTPAITHIPAIKTPQDYTQFWKGRNPTWRLEGRDHIHPVDHTTYDGPQDLSAEVFLAHDDQFLYVAANVTDDRHFNRYDHHSLQRGDAFIVAIAPPQRNNKTTTQENIVATASLKGKTHAMRLLHGQLQQPLSGYSRRHEPTKQTHYVLKFPLKELGLHMPQNNFFTFNCLFMDDDTDSGADYWLFLKPGLNETPAKREHFLPCILK